MGVQASEETVGLFTSLDGEFAISPADDGAGVVGERLSVAY